MNFGYWVTFTVTSKETQVSVSVPHTNAVYFTELEATNLMTNFRQCFVAKKQFVYTNPETGALLMFDFSKDIIHASATPTQRAV